MIRRVVGVALCTLGVGLSLFQVGFSALAKGDSDTATHKEAVNLATEDVVLKEQITKIDVELGKLHEQTARIRKTIQQTTDQSQKTALYGQLDGLQNEQKSLERLLNELIGEAKATEWTKIDAALKRAKKSELYQEREYEREEAIRDRRQQQLQQQQ